MKTWIKRISIGLVVVLVAAVVGLAIFLLTFDPNAYKSKLEEVVQERLHRTLTMDGDIELSLFPRIGLTLQGVSLSEPDSDQTFASIDSVRMAVAVWPLLSKSLVVDHMAISGFKARVVRDKQGRFNFHDLMADDVRVLERPANGAAAETPAAGTPATAGNMQIDIAGLDLKDGELQLQDEMTGMAVAVTRLNATTGRVTFSQPFDVSMSARIEGGYPRVDAGLTAQALLKLDPSTGHYSAQRFDVHMDGKLADAQAKSVAARGNMSFNDGTGKLDVAGLELVFQGDIPGKANPMSNVDVSIAMPKLVIDPHKSQFQIEKLAVRAKGGLAAGPFEFAMDAPGLNISPSSATGEALTGRVRLTGAEGVDASFGFTGISGNAAELDIREVKLDSTFKKGERTIKVGAASPLALNLLMRTAALPALRSDVTITDPALPKGTLQIPIIGSLAADLLKDQASARINAVLEGGKFDLTADVTRLSDMPAVAFALAVDTLDLDKLAPPAAAAVPAGKPAAADGKQAPAPASTPSPAASAAPPPAQAAALTAANDGSLDLSALVGPTANGTVQVGHLVARGVKADKLTASIKLEKGKLDVNGLAASLYQGTLAGRLSVDAANGNASAAQLKLDGIALAPLLADMAQLSAVSGTGSVALDLKSSGGNTYAMKNNLAGSAQFRLSDGAVKGINVAQTLRDLKNAMRAPRQDQEAVVPADPSRQTDFTRLDADMSFAAGVGTVKRLDALAPPLQVTQGSPATIDLVKGALDLVANVKVADGPASDQDLAELKGITVPVRLTGPYDQLTYRIDWHAVAADVMARAVQDTLKKALSGKKGGKHGAKAIKELGNVLKGINGK